MTTPKPSTTKYPEGEIIFSFCYKTQLEFNEDHSIKVRLKSNEPERDYVIRSQDIRKIEYHARFASLIYFNNSEYPLFVILPFKTLINELKVLFEYDDPLFIKVEELNSK